MAASPHAMRAMLSICETYSKDFLIRFNAIGSKSKCLSNCLHTAAQILVISSEINKHVLFSLDGSAIENVSSWPHLGHTVCSNCGDNYDIIDRLINLLVRSVT